ncbi:MAG: hypothetical protein ABIR80_00455 [Opitutaceae bacterium]
MKTSARVATTFAFALLVGGTSLFASPTLISVQSGGIAIGSSNTATSGLSAANAWTVNETMTGAGTLRIFAEDGVPLAQPGPTAHTTGAWFIKTVTNNTGVAWTSFEMELQEIIGTPSGQGVT